MITVTCQHTGVEFEARSKAAKNHPQVSAALDRVVKSSREGYGLLMEALRGLKEQGRKPTLEEFEALADEAIDAGREQRSINNAKWQRIREERRERRERRDDYGFNGINDDVPMDASLQDWLTGQSPR